MDADLEEPYKKWVKQHPGQIPSNDEAKQLEAATIEYEKSKKAKRIMQVKPQFERWIHDNSNNPTTIRNYQGKQLWIALTDQIWLKGNCRNILIKGTPITE